MFNMAEKSLIVDNASKIKVGEKLPLEFDGNRILLIRLPDGFYAVDEICTHENVSLQEGSVDNGEIECSKHGARFDIKTGDVRSLPAFQPLKIYSVTQQDNKILIHIPDKL
jgi:3-phenylpropionate/trans-cinnamate dioxygenase ferredoxin component